MTEESIFPLNQETAFGALLMLDYLQELFTAAQRQSFSQAEILVVLNLVKNDPEVFDPEIVLAYEIATGEIDNG